MLLPSVRGDELSCNYNQRQCSILDHIVDLLKVTILTTPTAAAVNIVYLIQDFFGVEDGGVKKAILEKSCMQLKTSIKLYRQTTETLVAEFMKDAATGKPAAAAVAILLVLCVGDTNSGTSSEVSYGEVQLEVRASRHPATGEFDGTIRGMPHAYMPMHLIVILSCSYLC